MSSVQFFEIVQVRVHNTIGIHERFNSLHQFKHVFTLRVIHLLQFQALFCIHLPLVCCNKFSKIWVDQELHLVLKLSISSLFEIYIESEIAVADMTVRRSVESQPFLFRYL